MRHSILIPFPGFYESSLSAIVDDEIEQVFDISDGGGVSAIPDVWIGAHAINYSAIYKEVARLYGFAWVEQFTEATGIALDAQFEEMTSPKYYNFETDRLFMTISALAVAHLFEASEADNHERLTAVIKERHTSYDGFASFYSNDLGEWLSKPVGTWDHNELCTLLLAVLAIHEGGDGDFAAWELLENDRCNGHISNAVYAAMTPELIAFADLQREHGRALDWGAFLETGKAWCEESGEPCPPLRCKETLKLPFTLQAGA
jgi:hypothetical protein